MALFAKNGKDWIDAWDADTEQTYSCAECNSPVRQRRIKGRFPHFYHLSKKPSCRLYSKSERHLILQIVLQNLLPKGETVLEKPFPQIHRIADLVWEKHKILFEVQCSPISEKEVRARKTEYGSLGYEIVWILDDRLFNQKRLRPEETFLRKELSYFALYSQKIFYDQLEHLSKGLRIRKGKKERVFFQKIHKTPTTNPPPDLPLQIRQRHEHRNYFAGDLVDLAQKNPRPFAWRFWEEKEEPKKNVWKLLLAKIQSWMNKTTQ